MFHVEQFWYFYSFIMKIETYKKFHVKHSISKDRVKMFLQQMFHVKH